MVRPIGKVQPRYTLTFYVREDILELLEELKRETGKSRSRIVLEALLDHYGLS